MFAFNLNVWAVLLAALAALAFGFVYYAKPVLGGKWMEYSGVKKEGNMKEILVSSLGNYLALFVTGVILTNMFTAVGISNLQDSLILTFWLWLALSGMFNLGMVWWEKKSFGLYLLNSVAILLELLLMAAILFTWA